MTLRRPPDGAVPSEFQQNWPVVLVAAAGCGLGISGLLTYTAGIFGRDLASAIGLSRTGLGAAFFLSTVALAVTLPIGGRLIDRFGSRWPAVLGSLMLSIGFLAIGTMVESTGGFVAAMAAIGAGAATSAPVAYTRAVNAVFDRSRGLALGLTQLGIGLSAMLVPPAIGFIVAAHGWQRGYVALAALALVGTVPALLLPVPQQERRVNNAPLEMGDQQIDRRVFWHLLLGFGLMALSFAGLLTHFVPMLREAGIDQRSAAALAGVIGLTVVVSRVIVGWLADRIAASRIAAASCFICASGCAALALGGADLAPAGAVALGVAIGAEADLIGYMVARSFGMAAYGRIYARQYAGFMLMAGFSPLWIGAVVDRTGSYSAALAASVLGLVVAAVVFLRLPPLRPRAADAAA